jgi:Ca2+-binding RTX toxin-like protein
MTKFTGTAGRDFIIGTESADRMLGLAAADRLEGRGGNDYIDGGSGADHVFGGAGNDHIIGGLGNDRIVGGLGDDTLTGGPGSDTFVYKSLADHSMVYGSEIITDWEHIDRIDLSAIDANSLIAGNQAFEFGGYSFGHPPTVTTPGTLTIGGFGGELWILGYTDSDPEPDLLINLWSSAGESALTSDRIVM